MTRRLSRRQVLLGTAGAAGVAAVGGWQALEAAGRSSDNSAPLPPVVGALPRRQHAWNDTLTVDERGNPSAPRHHRLLLFDLAGTPHDGGVRRLESVLRRLDAGFGWGPTGLLTLVGWGPDYFRRHTGRSLLPDPKPLSIVETPALERFDVCLHLAADDPDRLDAATAALTTGGGPLPDARSLALGDVLAHRETRSGFAGAGLPAAHQQVGGIPPGRPVPADAPLFMGFASNYRRNQASEDAVTIDDGPLAGGTTMHVSRIRLRLDSWYGGLDEDQRAARMFAPQVRARDVAGFTASAPTYAEELDATARRYGVVGHLQASAGARRGGKPVILRRDFNTVDGGQAGLHFVALQRDIADFEATRTAMNAAHASYENASITAEINNGVNEFMLVLARANYAVPPREQRSFPLLPGRARALR